MTDWKYLVITLLLSALLLGGIGVWIAHKEGGLSWNGAAEDQSLPGPVAPSEEVINTNQQTMETTAGKNPTATIKTNRGDITLELYEDAMPITVGNFLKLAESNFYDGTKFHRVMRGFMIQGGDPSSKGDDTSLYGRGGPGYTIKDEFVTDPRLTNIRGTIAMANTGQPNSGGSQFFINLADNTFLDFDKPPAESRHPVFGSVIAGMDVVDAIGVTETKAGDLPVDPVIISDVVIAR